MDSPEMADLDGSRITGEAHQFAAALFALFPELRQHAAMEREGEIREPFAGAWPRSKWLSGPWILRRWSRTSRQLRLLHP